jgi:predicted nucleic acid-binding protein
MAGLIDTSVFIEVERRGTPLDAVAGVTAREPIALAAITASELLVGVHRAAPSERSQRRAAFVEDIIGRIPILPFDLVVARVHARLLAELAATGRTVGQNDLLIAATAHAHGYEVLTLNVRDFGRVPGLVVRQPDR